MPLRAGTFAAMLLASWCVMIVTHELGHIIAGWAGGAVLVHAELRPWALPHSHFAPNPNPLLTLWGGPILGVVLPVSFAFAIGKPWAWFIADFCWVANGFYLALAWVSGESLLDTPRLLAQGAARWQIALFCISTIGPGYVRFRRRCVEWLTEATVESPVPQPKD